MVVLKPILSGEISKCCPNCSHIGLGSPISERTSFYRDNRRRGSQYRWNCRKCSRIAAEKYEAENREHMNALRKELRRRQRANMTPEQVEKVRKSARAYYLKKKSDPAYAARRLEASRRYKQRNKERLTENRRIDALLRKEQEGTWKPPPPDSSKTSRKSTDFLPIGPARNWLNELVDNKFREIVFAYKLAPELAKKRAVTEVVKDLQSCARSLYAWRYEDQWIDFQTIDRLATRHGGITVDQIYRDYGDGYAIFIGTGFGSSFSYLRIDYWSPEQ